MSCTTGSKKTYVFKAGDVLILPMQLRNRVGELVTPLAITEYTQIAVSINTGKGKHVADLLVTPYENQVLNTGWFTATSVGSTSTWPIGSMVLDVKVTIGGQSKHSLNFTFLCESSIT